MNSQGKRIRIAAAGTLLGALTVLGLVAQEPAQQSPPKVNPIPEDTPAPRGAPSGKTGVRFAGAAHFTGKQLQTAIADQITEMDQSGVNPAYADDAAFFLGNFYRNNGYANANVTWKVPGPHTLELDIQEGALTILAGIEFKGASGLPIATLKSELTSATEQRLSGKPKAPLPFVQADIDAGAEEIHGLYQSEGYLDAVVDPPKVKFNRDQTTAWVTITVHEGTQYHFGQITFAGDLVFYPNTELLNQLKPFTSKPYTPQQVINMQRAVVYYYKTHGYYDPKVDVRSDPKTAVAGKVPVSFTIDSGAIYRFGGVSEEGLDRLSKSFLPDRFASLKGKFYTPALLDEKFREMMETGLFRQVRIEPRPLPDGTLELNLKVQEEKARELGFSVGYGTFEGPIVGLVAGDRDLFGTGRPLTANAEFSAQILRGEIVYSDPWFFNSNYKFQTRIYGETSNWYRYNELVTGIRPQLSRQLTKQLEAAVFAEGRDISITDEGITPSKLGPAHAFVSTLGTSLTYDTRAPDKLNPRQGIIADTVAEVASSDLGGTEDFTRLTARVTYYIPVTSKTLLALGARGGWLDPLRGTANDISLDERFFNGGGTTVRSFPERRLGPADYHGYTIGGDTFTTFNAEFQFPLFGQVLGAVFADAGSVGETSSDFGPMGFAVGPGLRYASPVGPARLDLGINPDRRPGERHFMIQISVGMAF